MIGAARSSGIRSAPEELSSARRLLAGAGALWLLLVVGAGSRAAAEARSNLLLLTLDTVRADALGVNGAAGARTPNLDRLARAGVNFTRARAPVPLTLPSHASILTGSYPPTHGVRDNGTYRLADDRLTLAEVLQESGYGTAAFVGSFVLDRRFGLAQGFAVYDDHVTRDPAMLEQLEAERSAEAVLEAFERWLEEWSDPAPFFAWIHLFDPHAPYEPPEPHRSRHANDPYAGEVAYVDDVVGRILDALARRALLDRTLIAVVGDHGEGLGEHGETTHALLIYNSTLHVPMLLHAPGLVPAGVEVDDLVRVIDLAPTLLDYLGIGRDLGEGSSLREHVQARSGRGRARPAPGSLTAYSESLYGWLNLGWSPLHGLESEAARFILAPQAELYDLGADPGETANLIGARSDVARRLRAELRRIIAAGEGRRPGAASGTADPDAVANLRSLGYLSGSRSAPPAGRTTTGADPKSKLEVWHRIQLATARLNRGDYRSAAKTLAELLAADEQIPLLYDYLGSAYVRLEEWTAAESVYRRAIERGLGSAAMHAELGLIHSRRDEPRRAEGELLKAISLDRSSVVAHHRLGDVYRRSGRRREAVEQYRRALAINPDYVYAWNGLGMTLAEAGQDDQALAAFRRAVEAAPEGAQGLFNLAVQLERMERTGEALGAYQRVQELARADPELATELRRAAAAVERLRSEPR